MRIWARYWISFGESLGNDPISLNSFMYFPPVPGFQKSLSLGEGLFVWKPVWQLNVCWEAEAVAVRPVIYIEKNRRRR